jgi:hypothetical protein
MDIRVIDPNIPSPPDAPCYEKPTVEKIGNMSTNTKAKSGAV